MPVIPNGIYSEDFVNSLKANLPSNVNWNDLIFLDSGFITEFKNGKYFPLGCTLCINAIKSQNSLGEPTINGQNMLNIVDIYSEHGLPLEVASNVWVCPKCKMPQKDILPKFSA